MRLGDIKVGEVSNINGHVALFWIRINEVKMLQKR